MVEKELKSLDKKNKQEIYAECPDCFYEGYDFGFNFKTGFIICPKCKCRRRV